MFSINPCYAVIEKLIEKYNYNKHVQLTDGF